MRGYKSRSDDFSDFTFYHLLRLICVTSLFIVPVVTVVRRIIHSDGSVCDSRSHDRFVFKFLSSLEADPCLLEAEFDHLSIVPMVTVVRWIADIDRSEAMKSLFDDPFILIFISRRQSLFY